MPFHKWVGSKRVIAPDLFKIIPKPDHGRSLIVPFYGGGADSHWAIANKWASNYILSDANPELVNAHKVCASVPGLLIERLTAIKDRCIDLESTKAAYLSLREIDQKPTLFNTCSATDRAARFVFLVQCSFNGLWRENKNGCHNVPFGQRLFTFDVEEIFTTSTLLSATRIDPVLRWAGWPVASVKLTCRPYEATIAEAQQGDVVYCDPPYIPTSNTASFTSYTATRTEGGVLSAVQKRFDLTEHHALYKECLQAAQRGARVFVSNSQCEHTRRIYGCYREDSRGNPRSIVHTIKAPRKVSAKASSRGTCDELLIEVRP